MTSDIFRPSAFLHMSHMRVLAPLVPYQIVCHDGFLFIALDFLTRPSSSRRHIDSAGMSFNTRQLARAVTLVKDLGIRVFQPGQIEEGGHNKFNVAMRV